MSSLGLEAIASILKHGSPESFIDQNFQDYHFRAAEKPVYEYVKEHLIKFGILPDETTIKKHVVSFEGFPTTPTQNPKYYMEQLSRRLIVDRLQAAVVEAQPYLSPQNSTPEKGLEIIEREIINLTVQRHHKQIVDFRKAKEPIMADLKQKAINYGTYGIRTGWPYLDNMTQGLVGGDLVSIVGRPSVGKTWLMLYVALNAWFKQKRAGMFISMEMNPLLIQQRLISMQGQFALNDIKTGFYPTTVKQKMYKSFSEIESMDVPFWLVDGNMAASVDDIRLMAMQLQPDYIVIDGAYLLKHRDNRLDRFSRVAENTRMLKQALAEDQKVPVFASYQFNRDAAKKFKQKNGPSAGLEDIAFSDEVGQLSSLVLALAQPETNATLTRKKVTLYKGRNGEFGEWDINWDFNRMDFSEAPDLGNVELSFV